LCNILLIQMKLKLAVAVMAILVSIVAVSTLAVTGNIDARASGNNGGEAGSSGESGFYTAVCGPDPAHACQSPAEQ
jgi:hypothetical protein